MTSNLLKNMGLGNIDIGIVLLVMIVVMLILAILLIVLMVQFNKYKKKYNKFMQGKNAKSLEKDIMALYEDNVFIKNSVENNRKNIDELFDKHVFAFQKMGIIKYDAFKEMGGKLSFSLALLNEKNDGFVINSVHSSDGCYSYTKKIKDGESNIDLSNEEKEAVERAINSVKVKEKAEE